jgi:hypothetical protein
MRRLVITSAVLFALIAGACAVGGGGGGPSPKHQDTMDVQTFTAGRHDADATFQMKCRLGKEYGGDFVSKEKEYVCVAASNEERGLYGAGRLRAYAARDSDVGRQASNLLKDGGDHWLLITVAKHKGDPQNAELVKVSLP